MWSQESNYPVCTHCHQQVLFGTNLKYTPVDGRKEGEGGREGGREGGKEGGKETIFGNYDSTQSAMPILAMQNLQQKAEQIEQNVQFSNTKWHSGAIHSVFMQYNFGTHKHNTLHSTNHVSSNDSPWTGGSGPAHCEADVEDPDL